MKGTNMCRARIVRRLLSEVYLLSKVRLVPGLVFKSCIPIAIAKTKAPTIIKNVELIYPRTPKIKHAHRVAIIVNIISNLSMLKLVLSKLKGCDIGVSNAKSFIIA